MILYSEFDVLLAQKGNKDAFARLINQAETSMYRVSKSYFSEDNDCADAIQETILKAYYKLNTLKEPKYFKTWLIRILINECIKIYNMKKKVIPMEKLITNSCQDGLLEGIEIRYVINSLDDEIRLVILLYYYEDLSIKDIAKILSIPEGTVKSRLVRARSLLSQLLSHDKERGSKNG